MYLDMCHLEIPVKIVVTCNVESNFKRYLELMTSFLLADSTSSGKGRRRETIHLEEERGH